MDDNIQEAYEKMLINEEITDKKVEQAIANIDDGMDMLLKYFKKEEPDKYKKFKKISDDVLIFLENAGIF